MIRVRIGDDTTARLCYNTMAKKHYTPLFVNEVEWQDFLVYNSRREMFIPCISNSQ